MIKIYGGPHKQCQIRFLNLSKGEIFMFELSTAASVFPSSLGFGNWDLFFGYTNALFL